MGNGTFGMLNDCCMIYHIFYFEDPAPHWTTRAFLLAPHASMLVTPYPAGNSLSCKNTSLELQ